MGFAFLFEFGHELTLIEENGGNIAKPLVFILSQGFYSV
jgi:hypothetical protein